jgi:hypothetical protein
MPKQEPKPIRVADLEFVDSQMQYLREIFARAIEHAKDNGDEFWVYSEPSFVRMKGAMKSVRTTFEESLGAIAEGSPVTEGSQKGRRKRDETCDFTEKEMQEAAAKIRASKASKKTRRKAR